MSYFNTLDTNATSGIHQRAISGVLNILNGTQHEFLKYFGLDSANRKFLFTRNGPKIEWLETGLKKRSTTLTAAITDTVSTTFQVASSEALMPGHLIKIDDEIQIVASVPSSTSVTVQSRSYSTPATHSNGATVEVVGQARIEGAAASTVALFGVDQAYNYTSTLSRVVPITGTMLATDVHGVESIVDFYVANAVQEILGELEKNVFFGKRQAGSGTVSRSMGGLDVFVAQSIAAGGAIQKAHIDSLAESIRVAGGTPDLFVCHPSIANDLRNIIDNSSFVNYAPENKQFGMSGLKRIETQYGPLGILETANCPTNRAYVLDSRKVGVYELRPPAIEKLGKDGDSEKWHVVAEYSLVVANGESHGVITGIAT